MQSIFEDNREIHTENSMIRKKIKVFEDILPHVGDFGKYQKCLLLSIIPYTVVFCSILYSQVFLTLVPQEYWCKINELAHLNLTQKER